MQLVGDAFKLAHRAVIRCLGVWNYDLRVTKCQFRESFQEAKRMKKFLDIKMLTAVIFSFASTFGQALSLIHILTLPTKA